jgi:hypothetical protein
MSGLDSPRATPVCESQMLSSFLHLDAYVKWEDVGEFPFSSSKARRLTPFVERHVRNGCDSLITYGPIWSNQITLVAQLGQLFKVDCKVGIELPPSTRHRDEVDLSAFVEESCAVLGSFGADVEVISGNSSALWSEKRRRSSVRAGLSPVVIRYGELIPQTHQGLALCSETVGQLEDLRISGPVAVAEGSGVTSSSFLNCRGFDPNRLFRLLLSAETPRGGNQSSFGITCAFERYGRVSVADVELACDQLSSLKLDLFYNLPLVRALAEFPWTSRPKDMLFIKTGPQGLLSSLIVKTFLT